MDIRPVTGSSHTAQAVGDRAPTTAGASTLPAPPPATAVETASAVQQPVSLPNMEQVKDAIQKINKTMASLSNNLEFSIDEDSDRTIIKVVDQETKEVIRQFPTKETLEIAKALDKMQGLLIKQQA